jgi:hypothetical protein
VKPPPDPHAIFRCSQDLEERISERESAYEASRVLQAMKRAVTEPIGVVEQQREEIARLRSCLAQVMARCAELRAELEAAAERKRKPCAPAKGLAKRARA